MTQDSSITWNWKTQYWLDTATLGHGFGEAYDGLAERHPVLLARAL